MAARRRLLLLVLAAAAAAAAFAQGDGGIGELTEPVDAPPPGAGGSGSEQEIRLSDEASSQAALPLAWQGEDAGPTIGDGAGGGADPHAELAALEKEEEMRDPAAYKAAVQWQKQWNRRLKKLDKDGFVLGLYRIYFKEGSTGISTSVTKMRAGVASKLAEALPTVTASGRAGAHMRAAAVAPFELLTASPREVGRDGRPFPFLNALIDLAPKGTSRVSQTVMDNIVDLLKQNPEVLAVEQVAPPPLQAAPRAECGPYLTIQQQMFCKQKKPQLCCGLDWFCSGAATGQRCNDYCASAWGGGNGKGGGCRYSLPRHDITVTSANDLYKLKNMVITESIVPKPINPRGGYAPMNMNTIYNASLINYNTTIFVFETLGVNPHTDLNVIGGMTFARVNDKLTGKPLPFDNYRNDSFWWKDWDIPDTLKGNKGYHGTLVAGVAGALDNGVGPIGSLPGVKIFVGSMVKAFGKGDLGDTEGTIVDALQWVYDNCIEMSIAVVNMSWGLTVMKSTTVDAICTLITKARDRCGTVFVQAAGNEFAKINLKIAPETCSPVILVTNIDSCNTTTSGLRRCAPRARTDLKPGSANAGSNWLSYLDPFFETTKKRVVAAPGTNILSTHDTKAYITTTGTSFSAPLVAGIAARCFATGECPFGDITVGGGKNNTDRILSAFYRRVQYDAYWKWTGDTNQPSTVDYFFDFPQGDPRALNATPVTVANKTTYVNDRRYFGVMAWGGKW